jgi:RecB family exonuclease
MTRWRDGEVAKWRRLIRVADLAGFRRVLITLATDGDFASVRRRVVVVPTRASVELLRQTLEREALSAERPAAVWPDLLTRDEWMAAWWQALPGAPRLLSRIERDVLMTRAAEDTAARPRMRRAPFQIRPALVGAMLEFYDELHRRQRTVGRLRREVIAQLKGEHGSDRGSDSLIHQTAFLVLSFLKYQRLVAASGAADEHDLRARLLTEHPPIPHTHIVVAVADHPSDPRGLWPADFDLIGRLPGLRIDVVVTDELHDAGFRERLERELPGIEEVREDGAPWAPLVSRPDGDGWVYVSRDREDEVRDVVRVIRERAEAAGGALAPTALVVQRPLPYLYLARQVCAEARVPVQALDAWPLATAPWAAVVDLALTVATTGGTRESVLGLLRSPWINLGVSGRTCAALSAVLVARRVTTTPDAWPEEVERFFAGQPRRDGIDAAAASSAAGAAARLAASLVMFRDAAHASAQVATLTQFLRAHEQGPDADADWREEALRARGAVLGVLDALADACAQHDDQPRPVEYLSALIRHRLEQQTFAGGRSRSGVLLVDAVAARFGAFDHTHVLGLVDSDWPERQRRNIFYTAGLLKDLGWPQDADHTAAQLAAFRDLMGLPRHTTSLHAFQLDGEALVGPSPMVDLVRGLPSETRPLTTGRLVFDDEILAAGTPEAAAGLDDEVAAWWALRRARPDLATTDYRGQIAPRAPQPYKVSKVDRYVTCPFKYFAESVLRLPEEREESAGLTPLERGTLLHDLFERFYRQWHADGYGRITLALLPVALDRFATLARETLAALPIADRVLEETRLLGSLVARGVADRVFALEVDAADKSPEIVNRLLEQPLKGTFWFPRLGGLDYTEIAINGKADRIDVLQDGSLAVYDYKLGRMPDLASSLQIATYAHAVKQQLEMADDREHPVRTASYLAFGDDWKLEGPLAKEGADTTLAVEARAATFTDTVERIEAGRFPPQPLDTNECEWCSFAGVCRKEYVRKDDAAEPV